MSETRRSRPNRDIDSFEVHHETRSTHGNGLCACGRLRRAAGARTHAAAAGEWTSASLRGVADPRTAQASAATEAFYVNRWGDLEDAAKGLEQTARFLAKAQEVPAKNKDILNEVSGDLAKTAIKLKDAAVAQNVKDANDALQQINLKVRQLRLAD